VKLKREMSPEQRKEYLKGMVERIDVKFFGGVQGASTGDPIHQAL